MARWKAHVDFLITIIELLFLSLTVEALQGKTCQNSLLFGGVGQFEPSFQEKGSSLENILLVSRKLDTFFYLTVQTAPYRAMRSRLDTIPVCDRRTELL